MQLIANSSIYMAVKKYLKLLLIQKEILVFCWIYDLANWKIYLFYFDQTKKNNSSFLRKDEVKQNAIDALQRSSLSYTVSFCLKFNKELNDNDTYSIEALKKEFDLSTKQFSIWFIKAMSEIGSWTELENYTKQRGVSNHCRC